MYINGNIFSLWHFAKAVGNSVCYPSAALINGNQHGTDPDLWPHTGTGCDDPGPLGPAKAFPTYFTVNFCGADELRVGFVQLRVIVVVVWEVNSRR